MRNLKLSNDRQHKTNLWDKARPCLWETVKNKAQGLAPTAVKKDSFPS